jgi:hypothetical protein
MFRSAYQGEGWKGWLLCRPQISVQKWNHDEARDVQWGDTEIVALYNSKDSAHIVADFDTLPSARILLFIHEILGTKSLLCPKHVYQISKLEYWLKKDIEDLLARGSCKKCFIVANFDTLTRIVEFLFHMKFLG